MSTTTININLSTLTGWSELSDGTHAIAVKAKGSNYANSNLSSSVNVVKSTYTPPEQEGSNLTITQACFISQNGSELSIQ